MDDNEEGKEEAQQKADSIKIVLIGNSGVGKTCISQKYVNEKYTEQVGSTIGASYFQKFILIDGKPLKLDIWDTAGQEKYRAMGKMFYKDAYIVLFIYDITDKKSFIELKNIWYKELKTSGEKKTVLAVVGNKSDLFLNEQVNEDEAKKWANEIDAIFGLVSAKTGDCINLLFENVVRKYLSPDFVAEINKEKKNKGEKIQINNKNNKIDNKEKKGRKWFC